MKTIGFVDYWLDEWHANNYPVWIKRAKEELGFDFEVKYAWAELDSFEGSKTTDEWCKENGILRCQTIDELCEKSDNIILLAPSNPEKHLGYSRQVLKYGKPTYIDKTFAPDYKTGKEIFDIAEKCGVRIFSTSALRYATEIADYNGNAKCVSTFGTGRTVDEYIIHQVEMLVKCMGIGAESVTATNFANQMTFHIGYKDGRQANMYYVAYGNVPFSINVSNAKDETNYQVVQSDFFYNLIKDILVMFEKGVIPFGKEQTLEVMKVREASLKALKDLGKSVRI